MLNLTQDPADTRAAPVAGVLAAPRPYVGDVAAGTTEGVPASGLRTSFGWLEGRKLELPRVCGPPDVE